MERLTEQDKNGIAMAVCCGENCKHNFYCENGGFSECGDIDDIIDRLAAYEDTGLEPEEISKIREDVENGYMKSTARRYGISVDRLRELAQADREGRCVVLPCKIGASVWRLYDDCDLPGDCYTKQKCKGCEYRNLFIEEQAFCLSMLGQNGKLNPPYYTTNEEAQDALRREQK